MRQGSNDRHNAVKISFFSPDEFLIGLVRYLDLSFPAF